VFTTFCTLHSEFIGAHYFLATVQNHSRISIARHLGTWRSNIIYSSASVFISDTMSVCFLINLTSIQLTIGNSTNTGSVLILSILLCLIAIGDSWIKSTLIAQRGSLGYSLNVVDNVLLSHSCMVYRGSLCVNMILLLLRCHIGVILILNIRVDKSNITGNNKFRSLGTLLISQSIIQKLPGSDLTRRSLTISNLNALGHCRTDRCIETTIFSINTLLLPVTNCTNLVSNELHVFVESSRFFRGFDVCRTIRWLHLTECAGQTTAR
jgi:hypothetical protein